MGTCGGTGNGPLVFGDCGGVKTWFDGSGMETVGLSGMGGTGGFGRRAPEGGAATTGGEGATGGTGKTREGGGPGGGGGDTPEPGTTTTVLGGAGGGGRAPEESAGGIPAARGVGGTSAGWHQVSSHRLEWWAPLVQAQTLQHVLHVSTR